MEECQWSGEKRPIEELVQPSISPQISYFSSKEKVARRTKKDILKQKKKTKANSKFDGREEEQEGQPGVLKLRSDEDNSVTTNDSGSSSSRSLGQVSQLRGLALLERLTSKPHYITLTGNNRILGDFGHASVIFKRPIIQGLYYLDIQLKEDIKKQKKPLTKSAVRVGICKHEFNPLFPLGYEDSIAYKSVDGSILKGGEEIGKGQTFTINDIISIVMKIGPPHKHPNPNEINEDSTVSFYKNGELVFEYSQLRQVFYCFGVSLYNYSQVQILYGPCKAKIAANASHYFKVVNQHILYKDLENNRIFKI